MEKDEENEEGDHGSIVAFRIPYRPSVDFRPLPLHSPLQLLQHRLCTPCISPPPFVPSTIVPVIPQSPLPGLLFPLHHPATRTRPSTAVAYLQYLHASTCTRRYAGPDPPTRHQTLFSPLLLFHPSFPHPSFISTSRLTLYFSRAAFSPSLFLPRSFSLPLAAFPAAASRHRRAKLARHRVGQWRE